MYGSTTTTSLQPLLGRPPRIQEYTSCRVSVFCCWTNVWTAVKKLATVTPPSTRVAASRSRPADRLTAYVSATATMPPTNATGGKSS